MRGDTRRTNTRTHLCGRRRRRRPDRRTAHHGVRGVVRTAHFPPGGARGRRQARQAPKVRLKQSGLRSNILAPVAPSSPVRVVRCRLHARGRWRSHQCVSVGRVLACRSAVTWMGGPLGHAAATCVGHAGAGGLCVPLPQPRSHGQHRVSCQCLRHSVPGFPLKGDLIRD